MTPDKRNLLRGRGLVFSRLVFRIQIDKQDAVCNGRWVALLRDGRLSDKPDDFTDRPV